MTKYVANITANNQTVYLCDIHKKRDFHEWKAGVIVYGTFSGGTVTLYISPDNGSTLVPMMDASGTPITSTANDNYTTSFGGTAKNNDAAKLYVGITGATTPTITYAIYDNNG